MEPREFLLNGKYLQNHYLHQILTLGFDPEALRVSELRKILKDLGIKHAANAKKKELLELYDDQVIPQIPQLREKYNHQTNVISGTIESSSDDNRKVKTKKRKRKVEPDEPKKKVAKPKQQDTTDSSIPEAVTDQRTPQKVATPMKVEDLTDDEFIESLANIIKPASIPSLTQKREPSFNTDVLKSTLKQTLHQVDSAKLSSPTSSKLTPSKLVEEETTEFNEARNRIISAHELTTDSEGSTADFIHHTPKHKNKGRSLTHITTSSSLDTPSKQLRTTLVDGRSTLNEPLVKFTTRPSLKKPDVSYISDEDVDEDDDEGFSKDSIKAQSETTPEPTNLRSKYKETPSKKMKHTSVKHVKSNPNSVLAPTKRSVAVVKNEPSQDLLDDSIDLSDDDYDAEGDVADEYSSTIKKGLPNLFAFFVWALLVALWAFGIWYRQQVFTVGYCGQELPHATFGNSSNHLLQDFGKWLDNNARPQCVPCPQHARCFTNLELGCFEEFTEYVPWNNWIFPTNKRCVSDTKRAEKIVLMIENAKDLLREKNARRQCGTCPDDIEAGISLSDLYNFLLDMKAPYITVDEFNELWNASIVQLEKEREIIVRQVCWIEAMKTNPNNQTNYTNIKQAGVATSSSGTPKGSQSADEGKDDHSSEKVFRSTSLRNLSLRCQFRNSVVGLMARYKREVLILGFIMIVIKLTKWKLAKFKDEKIKLEIIYKDVVKRLYDNAKRAKYDPNTTPYIGLVQLRDIILANEHNLKRRVQLWTKVARKVEANTNINAKVIEDHGEIFKVWQWVSDVDHIDHQWVSPKGTTN